MDETIRHYESAWGKPYQIQRVPAGPYAEPGSDFRVATFAPRRSRAMWTYATVGMARTPEAAQENGLEVHLFAPSEGKEHVELLAAVSFYHNSERPLGWGHTVSFGRPWLSGSRCSYGLLSLPYLDGPRLEWMKSKGREVRFLWLLPITGAERNYVIEQGVEALEQLLERANLDYCDPLRQSVV